MDEQLQRLFSDFDRGRISRRSLLTALGFAAVATPFASYAQGRCGGTNAGSPDCDTTPAPPPFAATGWKTTYLDHFTVQVADYQKEAAYYSALMNWKVRNDDGKQALLDIGDGFGGLLIKGGYEPPAPPASAAPPAAPPAGDSGGRGAGGRGGRGGGGGRGPARALFTGFAFGIDKWDRKKVEEELKKRGLNPVADHDGKGFESFHVTDPGGFDLQITNGSRKNRRTSPANGKLQAPPPFESPSWKTVWLDHISFNCPNYKATTAFYAALIGWVPSADEGSQNECQISPEIGGIIIRGGGPQRAGQAIDPNRRSRIDHISFGIVGFDPDAVKAELDKRGLNARADTGGSQEIHVAPYKSYHTTTPNGFDLQISNRTTPPNR